MRSHLILTALAVTTFPPTLAFAQACYVDKAIENDGKLDVYIREIGAGSVGPNRPNRPAMAFVAQEGRIIVRGGPDAGKVVDHISVVPGDELYLQAEVHSNCHLKIVGVPGSLGYDWSSSFTNPSGPFQFASGHITGRPGRSATTPPP